MTVPAFRHFAIPAAAMALMLVPLAALRAQQHTPGTPPRAGAPLRPTASAPAREIAINRESFTYQGEGRRDPYTSLMTSAEVRPLLSDLRLTGVAYDPDGQNSVAIMRDLYNKAQYRVRVGQQLGRLRVTAIRQRSVQFSIDEFGFSRTESLPLSRDSSAVRNP